jgi:3-deoxy-7-phosphoheptulonate synthase
MIIQLKEEITFDQKDALTSLVDSLGYSTQAVSTRNSKYLVCIGTTDFDIRIVGSSPGVKDVHRVSDSYKLVSRKWKQQTQVIKVGDAFIGGDEPVVMAGPCSIESEEQVVAIVNHLKRIGVHIMRGGVFKPRSSPYAFQGLGLPGLKMFHEVCHANGIAIVSEVMEIGQIDAMHPYVDIFQVGARNTQNFNLLRALGSVGRPVLLKRGISGSIEELLQSAEYIFSSGNEEIMLCERGIRSFETAYRNTFDINAIPLLKQKSHLPVIADPSHGIGLREHVPAIALASVVAGADGVIYEVHPQPERALSDGQQTLNFDESRDLKRRIDALQNVLTMVL